MKKSKLLMIATIVVAFALAKVIILTNRHVLQNKTKEILNYIEDAMNDNWEKQTATEVFDYEYSDEEGNTIIYYICITTYYEADYNVQAGLNANAILPVIDPNEAESYRECSVSGLPAAICQKGGRSYLCWTITPELSCVIEYDPDSESEADIFRMAESVPRNTLRCNN